MGDTSKPRVIAVAGIAGSGKTTLGRALASSLRLPLLDLDSVSNPLLDSIAEELWGSHWLAAPNQTSIRAGRYAALRAVARDVVATAGGCVLAAPFTAELTDGAALESLQRDIGEPVRLVHLTGDPGLFASRRALRGEPRDSYRLDVPDPRSTPAIPVIEIDADLTTGQQLLRVRRALGQRSAIDPSNSLFQLSFHAVLFDLDGALVDSTASVLRSWRRFAAEFEVPLELVDGNYGRAAAAHVQSLVPPDRAAEGISRIEQIETEDAHSVTLTPGAHAFFAAVPDSKRAIVTSGSDKVASSRLQAVGLDVPQVFVTIDHVTRGKPDPEPFLLAAHKLGVDPFRCLVVEDSTAGAWAAQRAGCRVLALTGTVTSDELSAADLVVDGLDRLTISEEDGQLRLSRR